MALAEHRTAVDEISLATPRDYFALLKPRVMSLVVFTGFVGLYVAPGSVNPVIGAIAILCIAIGAGASGALNMWYDADIDAVMSRTASRPIPAGRVAPGEALGFGSVFSGPLVRSSYRAGRLWGQAMKRKSRPIPASLAHLGEETESRQEASALLRARPELAG